MEYHIFTQIHTFLIASSFFDSRYEFLLSKFCLILNFCQKCSTLRPFYLLKGSRNRKMNCQTLVDTSPRFIKKNFSQIGELSFSGGFRRFWAISSHSAPPPFKMEQNSNMNCRLYILWYINVHNIIAAFSFNFTYIVAHALYSYARKPVESESI